MFTFVVVESLSYTWLFLTPQTAAYQDSLSFTISQSLFKLMSTELVMPSNHLILCHPILLLPSIFPSSGSFPLSWLFSSGGQSIEVSVSASVLPIQGWSPLGLCRRDCRRDSQESFSAPWFEGINFYAQPWSNSHSHPYVTTGKTRALTIWTFVG